MHRPRTPFSRFHPAPITLAALICLGGGALHSPNASAAEVTVAITAQPLAQALNELARQAGLTLVVSPTLVAGKTAPAVSGRLTPQDAFARLLAGSGLSADIDGQAVTIRPQSAPKASDAALPAVTVSAKAERSATTEQSGSYTTPALTIGKLVQSIRETPQSVTVVTRQQMTDQNLVSIEDVIAQTTGTSKTQRNFGSHTYTMRGFVIPDDNYLLDGVSSGALSPTGWVPMDTAIFDRVEVLRGAGALVVGAGDPSGVVNMVRKRPRAEAHFEVAQSIGSWNNFRTEVDAGGSLNQAGSVRGRVVAAYTDRDYFYDLAHTREPMLYGVIDADVGASTKLTAGYRHQTVNTPGYTIYGLPSYTTGASLELPRSTSLGQRWNRHKATTNDFFVELAHQFEGDWAAKLTVNHGNTDFTQKLGTARRAVNPATMVGARYESDYYTHRDMEYSGLDAHVTGSFKALGGTHQAMFGTSWSLQDTFVGSTTSTARSTAVDIFNFNHDLRPELATPAYVNRQELRNEIYGLYGSTRLELAKSLHLSLGGRLNWYKYRSDDLRTGRNINDYSQDAEFTPYAGLVYDLGPQWSVYASYADTFVTQSQYENAAGNALSPATGANYEAGIKGELFERKLNVAFAVFYIKKNGVAAYDTPQPTGINCGGTGGTSVGCYHTEDQRSKGFDAEASGQIARGWQVAAGYTYLTSSDAAGKSLTSDAPRNLLRASTSYNLPGEWSAWTVGGNVAAQSGAYVETVQNPGRTVLDLRASYRINPHWTAALNIGNVTDKTYWTTVGSTIGGNNYGTPRNATLTLRGSF